MLASEVTAKRLTLAERRKNLVVAAYVPEYRAGINWNFVATHATDLILFSVEPLPDGGLKPFFPLDTEEVESPLNQAKSAAAATGDEPTRLMLCVGGAGRSSGFASIVKLPHLRKRLIGNIVELLQTHGLSGVDFDWEIPMQVDEIVGYAHLLEEAATELHKHDLLVTVAVHAWQDIGPPSYKAVDRVHLMSYDAEGEHATMEKAVSDVKRLVSYGCPKRKIALGLPFYGRGLDRPDLVLTYGDLVSKVGADLDPTADVLGEDYAIGFNNVLTCQRKTKWALKNGLAGIMAWEAGQDTDDPSTSLLKAIADARLGRKVKGRYKKKNPETDPRFRKAHENIQRRRGAGKKRRRRKPRRRRQGIDL